MFSYFQKYGSGFKDAMKYVLPKLLLGPIYHCRDYFQVIKVGLFVCITIIGTDKRYSVS